MPWFILPSGKNPTRPTDYVLTGVKPVCTGRSVVGAIFATYTAGGYPFITSELRDQIIWALHKRSSTQRVLLKT